MKALEQIFDSRARVRLMRLFLLNPKDHFENSDLADRTQESAAKIRKELAILAKAKLIKKGSFSKDIKKGKKMTKKKTTGWRLNEEFPFRTALEHLLVVSVSPQKDDIIARLKKVGNIKLIILSGVFIRKGDSKVDVLIVGDNLRKSAVEAALRGLEAEVGKELSYAFFETYDFKYRMSVYDKFIRDILDFPHEKVMNKLSIV